MYEETPSTQATDGIHTRNWWKKLTFGAEREKNQQLQEPKERRLKLRLVTSFRWPTYRDHCAVPLQWIPPEYSSSLLRLLLCVCINWLQIIQSSKTELGWRKIVYSHCVMCVFYTNMHITHTLAHTTATYHVHMRPTARMHLRLVSWARYTLNCDMASLTDSDSDESAFGMFGVCGLADETKNYYYSVCYALHMKVFGSSPVVFLSNFAVNAQNANHSKWNNALTIFCKDFFSASLQLQTIATSSNAETTDFQQKKTKICETSRPIRLQTLLSMNWLTNDWASNLCTCDVIISLHWSDADLSANYILFSWPFWNRKILKKRNFFYRNRKIIIINLNTINRTTIQVQYVLKTNQVYFFHSIPNHTYCTSIDHVSI